MPRIIGITGTNGAGKGALVVHLVERHGFVHHSVSGFIVEEIVRRGHLVNRDTMIAVGNDLRLRHGPEYIIDSLWERVCKSRSVGVIESLRALAEVRRVRELGGFIIGIDADPRVRYERIRARGGAKDKVSFNEFCAQERSEMNSGDPVKQDLLGALTAADIIFMNNGTLEELYAQLARVLEKARQ